MGLRALVLEGADERDVAQLSEYRAVGGYEALAKARARKPQEIVGELVEANLRGRGGAGFPMGKKASFLAKGTGKPTYLVVNADESEPGSFKDREIMLRTPHRLIEGCLITAHAIEAERVMIYLRGEYLDCFEALTAALGQVREEELLEGVTIVVHRGAGAYICGEESALLESLEGKRGQPRSRPPFPAVAGLYASPTLINNVQTIATVPVIVGRGAKWYLGVGAEGSPGTIVFSLSGNVVRPGNYELELGTTLRELIYDIGGGVPAGRELKAVIPGGSSVTALTPDQLDVPLDYSSVAEAGSALGAAAVIVIDDRACIVQLALRASQFYMHESCGKCTPCREGTRWMVSLLERIEEGRGTHGDLDLLASVCDRIQGKSLCALGDFAAWPVAGYIAGFRDEFEAHIEQGGCPYDGQSSLEGVVAPVSQHTHQPTVEAPA